MAEKPKEGPFGEPLFPEAKEDLRVGAMIRYLTKADFHEIARFYRNLYDGNKRIRVTESKDDKDQPVLSVGVNEKLGLDWTAIVVTVNPDQKKKSKHVRTEYHIMVVGRDEAPELEPEVDPNEKKPEDFFT